MHANCMFLYILFYVFLSFYFNSAVSAAFGSFCFNKLNWNWIIDFLKRPAR